MPTTRLKSCTICAGASSLCESTGLDTPAHIVCKTDVLPLALRLPFTIFANGHFQPRQPMNKISFWLHNARHISLPQSILPAVLATGMAVQYDTFSWWLALIALFGVACAHLGMNLADGLSPRNASQTSPQAASVAARPAAAKPEAPAATSLSDQIALVKQLKELLDAGILTEEEFEKKKRDVLGL